MKKTCRLILDVQRAAVERGKISLDDSVVGHISGAAVHQAVQAADLASSLLLGLVHHLVLIAVIVFHGNCSFL